MWYPIRSSRRDAEHVQAVISRVFFINPQCLPGIVPSEDASIDVLPDEATNAPEREAPVAVLETGNNKAGEHHSVAEVGPGKEPTFSE